ncbi:MAG: hypothetical protein JXR94_20905 [Candidatus Hydrogenedentes bacterium]|nr:hypothetical protein [Candidatus Hydrogenedentota bacterium]
MNAGLADGTLTACIPLPLQVVIDDLGWWCGADGHERNEPFRTGIARNHVPADYEAIAYLGRELGMRPQAAMILCEWDRDNILRALPSSTWMGADWDNRRWIGPWLDEAADIIRRNRDCFEVTLHGIGHEFWLDGRMERAEWHDANGRMRPRDEILRHIEFFARLLEQHRLGPFPESFVPAAFLHRFGVADGGLAAILAGAGIRYISTPFQSMHLDAPPCCLHFGVDAGTITVDRGRDLRPWYDLGPAPGGLLTGPVCGMHWPNLLHADPARNHEVVDRWIDLLRLYGDRVDTMLARDTRAFCTQLIHRECARLDVGDYTIHIDLAAVRSLHAPAIDTAFEVRVESDGPLRFESPDAAIECTVSRTNSGGTLHRLAVAPKAEANAVWIRMKPSGA